MHSNISIIKYYACITLNLVLFMRDIIGTLKNKMELKMIDFM